MVNVNPRTIEALSMNNRQTCCKHVHVVHTCWTCWTCLNGLQFMQTLGLFHEVPCSHYRISGITAETPGTAPAAPAAPTPVRSESAVAHPHQKIKWEEYRTGIWNAFRNMILVTVLMHTDAPWCHPKNAVHLWDSGPNKCMKSIRLSNIYYEI